MPKVTVLMSVYNGEQYIREAIDSILGQTFKDFEFIIINDGSTDHSRELILSCKDPRIRLVDNKKNIGLTCSLNNGLRIAEGEYIARMDADDISLPARLEKQVEFLDAHPSTGVLGINSWIIDEQGNQLKELNYPASHNGIMAMILVENRFVHSSIMLRKKVLEVCGYYLEDYQHAQDYELLLRLSLITHLANLAAPLHKWRKNYSAGISVVKRPEQIIARDRIRKAFLEKHFTLDKDYIKWVLTNFRNNPKDEVLSGYLVKISRAIPFFSKLFTSKLKIQYYLLKRYFCILSICGIAKGKIKSVFHVSVDNQKMLTKYKKRNHPYSLIFLMKNICNARCIMCGLSYANNKDVAEIRFRDYKIMLSNLEMDKMKEITFSGGGDPLLCKDLIEIIDYTSRTYPGIKLSVYTNGIALTEKFSEEFIKHNLCYIVISINASTKEVHHKVMGVNSFNNVVENIRTLVVLRNEARAKTQIRLSFVASQLNIDDLPGLINLGADLGVDEVKMQYCRFYSRKSKLDSIDSGDVMDKKYSLYFDQAHSDEIIRKAKSLVEGRKIIFSHEPLFSNPEQPKKQCAWPWTTILVGPYGEIYPCGGGEVMFYKPIQEKKLYFGNLFNEHISIFWNNESYKKLRKSCDYQNKDKSIPQCWSCNHTLEWEGLDCERSHFINID